MSSASFACATILAGLLLSCGGTSQPSSSEGGELQRTGRISDRLVEALRADPRTALLEGKTWELSRNNALPADWLLRTPEHAGGEVSATFAFAETCEDAACDADFRRRRCDTSADCAPPVLCRPLQASRRRERDEVLSVCAGHSDGLLDREYEVIAGAEKFVDVVSLVPPNGRFVAATRNALDRLDEKHVPIEVRLLFSDYPTSGVDAQQTFLELTRDLAPDTRLRVTVGTFRASITSWNHAKIVAADGAHALVGGHNLWDPDYLNLDPVTDVSMRVDGLAAASAQRFANELWAGACASTVTLVGNHGSVCPTAFVASPVQTLGDVPVLGVGRLGAMGDNTSDRVLVDLIDQAQKAVRLSQQDIGPANHWGVNFESWPRPILDALARAVLRGVDVYLVQSNPGATAPSGQQYSFGWQPEEFVRRIFALVKRVRTEPDARSLVCERLHVAPIRLGDADSWPDGQPFANHSKVIVIDEDAFYVGSQNLYRSNLAEYGYVIDDQQHTSELLQSLWEPLWKGSSRAAVSGSEAAVCDW